MSMTREDVLRELELLPVWQLRVPIVSPVKAIYENTEAQKIEAEKIVEATFTEASFYLVVSDDKKWAFVLSQALTGTAQILFNNILLALQLNKTHTETVVNSAGLLAILADVKVILAMGEAASQQLLNSNESLEQLRGKVHVFESVPLVVTFHPDDLLQPLANKANMWDDLCIAKPLVAT